MIKLVDQLSAMGSFPIATAQDIVCSDNERLQEKIDNGTLGGGGGSTATTLTQEEYDALDSQEQLEGEFYCYDSARHFRNGVEYGKAVDISGKQDNLDQVKFTMRRNSASEGRYCLIGSSDLLKNLLMCEPYRFQGVFGRTDMSVEGKSMIDLSVSFREGAVADKIFSGYANSSEGFNYVDLVVTVDDATNTAYVYVDFKTSASVASGEITKPSINAESYMDFAESFELVDSMIGVELCRMSDYCKVITEIKDEVSDFTVWSSKKTSDELKNKLLTKQIAPNSLGFDVGSTVTLEEFLRAIYNKYGTSGTLGFWWSGSNEIYVEHNGTKVKINGGIFTWESTNINIGWQHITAIYAPNSSANTMYKMFLNTGEEAGTITSQGIEVIPTLSDTSSTTSTYSSAKIDKVANGTTFPAKSVTQYIKFTLGDWAKADVIRVADNYGGKIEIVGSHDSAYQTPKVIRYSYGDWLSYDVASTTRYKIRGLYRYSNENCYYLEIEPNTTFSIQGAAITPEVVTELPVATSAMTLIPESEYATKSDLGSNVALTTITFDSTYATATSGGHGCTYTVRNGICYVNMDVRMNANGKICTLPKPLMSVINIPMTVFMHNITGEVEAVNNGILMVNSDGSATTLGALTNESRYMLNFSYPIA